MCNPISVNSDGQGNIYCFPWELRRQIYAGELKNYDPDSHTSIAHYHGVKGEDEDKLNKWEYDFASDILTVDQINTTDDRKAVKTWIKQVGPDYFYPPDEVAKITVIHGNLSISGIPLNWENLSEVNGAVWATNCAFPVLAKVGDVRATNCAFPVLTEVNGDVWDCKDCSFPVLTEVNGAVRATNCAFPVLAKVGDVRDCKDCSFPVLTEVNGAVRATNCAFPVLAKVGDVWDCKDCSFPVLTEVNGDVRATNCAFPVLAKVGGVRGCKNCTGPLFEK